MHHAASIFSHIDLRLLIVTVRVIKYNVFLAYRNIILRLYSLNCEP